jgi:CDP-diglyceride synthetase
MEIIWSIILTIIVFIIVFLVSWKVGKIRAVSAVALGSIISLLFMYVVYPPLAQLVNIRDTISSGGLVTVYWILYFLFIFYIITYVIYIAVIDKVCGRRNRECCVGHWKDDEELFSSDAYTN